LVISTFACSIFERRSTPARSCSIRPSTGKLRREHTHDFFSARAHRQYPSACHSVMKCKAVTVAHQGLLEENPVSIQAPKDARSLSYG
jgi:hypothetical protein